MSYDPTKKRPIAELTQFEVAVFELRASGVSIRDMYKGFRVVLVRKPPTYREILGALDRSGADPRPFARGGIYDSHLLYDVVVDPDTEEKRAEWVRARRVGTTPKYPGFRVHRRREAKHERTISSKTGLPEAPPGTVDRLVVNFVLGHVIRSMYKMRSVSDYFSASLDEDHLKNFEEGRFFGEGSP